MEQSQPGFFQRWIVQPLIAQLRQGVTPSKLALTMATGGALGIFPILGSTTVLCLIAGVVLRLNQPILQILNYLLYPVHLLLIPIFIRIGEKIFHAPPMTFSLPELISFFRHDPIGFMREFGMAGLHGIAAWALIVPLTGTVLYYLLLPLLRRLSKAAGLEDDPS